MLHQRVKARRFFCGRYLIATCKFIQMKNGIILIITQFVAACNPASLSIHLNSRILKSQIMEKCADNEECKLAVESQAKYDFIFVHVKAADSLAEDGDWQGKKEFIERIDQAVPVLNGRSDDTLLVWTADHSTASEMKAHAADPVPILFHGGSVRRDQVTTFGERSFAGGGYGFINGLDVMPQVQNILGKLHLVGA